MVMVVICSYFEEEHVERIRAVDERLRVLYREDLVRRRAGQGTTWALPNGAAPKKARRSF